MEKPGNLFIISASSGAGKTSVVNGLLERFDINIMRRVITYTSRSPRPKEVHGKDYYFINEQEFVQKIDEKFFIEWSQAYGAYYGSPKYELENLYKGTSLIMVLDLAGVNSVISDESLVRKYSPITIWIEVPDLKVLEERLLHRGSEKDEQLKFRLELAKKESANKELLARFHHKLINNDLKNTIDQLENIVKKNILFP